ncbi:iron-sulfur cluster assembly accessory protein [uncultured Brevundimonas sp.]|uniref:HesB/IscA family protein n=1 Tax=uncultured Brevundimonas sp. TaxID=213418 RepID=UPI0025E0CBB1|nr:iron-sulfur cluster assembly accessory protein [uncultured Brevundimonas sp.]
MTELQTTPRPRRPRPAVLTLTEAAAERVCALTEAGGHKALRVGLKNAGCAGQEYTFAFADEIGPLDEVVTDKGATIVIDPKAILFLIGSEIDYETTRLASKFVFRNPNQTDACGCGESVTIVPAKALDVEEQAD